MLIDSFICYYWYFTGYLLWASIVLGGTGNTDWTRLSPWFQGIFKGYDFYTFRDKTQLWWKFPLLCCRYIILLHFGHFPHAEWVWLGGTIDTVIIWLGTGLTCMCLCFLSESHRFARRTLHFNLEDSKHQLIIPRPQLVIHLPTWVN